MELAACFLQAASSWNLTQITFAINALFVRSTSMPSNLHSRTWGDTVVNVSMVLPAFVTLFWFRPFWTAIMFVRSLLISTSTMLSLCGPGLAQKESLQRDQLMQYQAADEMILPVKTEVDWQHRRGAILAAMQTVMGPERSTNRRVDLQIEVLEKKAVGNYERRLITFQSEPESRTPAYLCLPNGVLTGKQKATAVLCLHPTDNKAGHKVALGLGGKKGRQYGTELAERGYVTISPAYPQLANYWPNLEALGYESGTMKAIWDNSRCLDLLESLDNVDMNRGVAAIGHSLGGHNAIYSAVFDDRISVVVTSCGFDSYRDYQNASKAVWFYGKGWCSSRYMPRMSNYRGRLDDIPFDFTEMVGALAPRPLFVNAPLHDSNFQWKSVDYCVEAAKPVYALMNTADAIQVYHPDCGHDFPVEIRNAAYQFIEAVLRP